MVELYMQHMFIRELNRTQAKTNRDSGNEDNICVKTISREENDVLKILRRF